MTDTKQKRLRLCRVLLVCSLLFIWGNSLLPGSVSGALSQWLHRLLQALVPGEDMPPEGGGLLRKIAHFTEFACLGALLLWHELLLCREKVIPGALLFGFATACIDETIQCFVPDRGPSVWDVCLDTCGAAAGILLLLAGLKVRKTKNNKHLEEKT